MKNNKNTFITIFIIIILIPLSFILIKTSHTEACLKECDDIIERLRRENRDTSDNNNFPDFAKDYVFADDFDLNKSSYYSSSSKTIIIPELKEDTLYDSKKLEEYSQKLTEFIPKDLSDYKNKFAPSIIKKMKEEKRNDYPSPEETMNTPKRPTNRLIGRTVDYWCALSFELAKRGDYNTSLLLPLGAFYLIREEELFYGDCSDFSYKKIVTSNSNKNASIAIISWASRPRYESKELSKKVALDILAIVKLDCNLTRYIDYYKYFVNQVFARLNEKNMFSKNVYDSSLYKKLFDLLINKALDLESKPFYEADKEYGVYNYEIKDYTYDRIGYDSSYNPLPDFLFNRENLLIQNAFSVSYKGQDLHKERENVEEYLGYMEFAAIALLINSYYCYNNKLPETIEKLEEWCNTKLPTKRKDNSPYVIDTEGEHTLTFKENKYSYYSYYYKPLYFNFAK